MALGVGGWGARAVDAVPAPVAVSAGIEPPRVAVPSTAASAASGSSSVRGTPALAGPRGPFVVPPSASSAVAAAVDDGDSVPHTVRNISAHVSTTVTPCWRAAEWVCRQWVGFQSSLFFLF